MKSLYVGYTLADIVGLASSNTFTYLECTEILEEELMKRFSWIDPAVFYPQIRKKAVNDQDYCERLVKAGKQLEEVVKS